MQRLGCGLAPAPPTEKATARQDEARQSSTNDGTRNWRRINDDAGEIAWNTVVVVKSDHVATERDRVEIGRLKSASWTDIIGTSESAEKVAVGKIYIDAVPVNYAQNRRVEGNRGIHRERGNRVHSIEVAANNRSCCDGSSSIDAKRVRQEHVLLFGKDELQRKRACAVDNKVGADSQRWRDDRYARCVNVSALADIIVDIKIGRTARRALAPNL
jgi:hypothetical protein